MRILWRIQTELYLAILITDDASVDPWAFLYLKDSPYFNHLLSYCFLKALALRLRFALCTLHLARSGKTFALLFLAVANNE